MSGPVLVAYLNESSDRTIAGKYVFDRTCGGALIIPSGAAFPAAPCASELFFNTTDGVLYRRDDGDTAWVPVSGAASDFGSQYQQVEDLAISTIIGTAVLQSKLLLTTPVLPAGDYRVGVGYGWNHNAPFDDFIAEFREDGVPLEQQHQQEPKDAAGTFGSTGTNQKHYAYRVFHRTLTAAVHTFELFYGTAAAAQASSIWDAKIEFWRVA